MHVSLIRRIGGIEEQRLDNSPHRLDCGVVLVEGGSVLILLDLAAAADRYCASYGQHRRLRGEVHQQVDGTHRVADEVCRVDAQQRAEPGDVPDSHAATVGEVDDFRRVTEAQHVGGQHAVVLRERRDQPLPADFSARPEFATVQEHDGIALPRLEEVRPQAVDDDGPVLMAHLIAMGLTGEPTAPVTLSGGATS